MSVSMVFMTPTRCITPSPPSSPNPSGFTMQDTPMGTVSPVTYKFPVPVSTNPPTFADEHARHEWKKFHKKVHKNDNTRSYTVNPKGFKRTKN